MISKTELKADETSIEWEKCIHFKLWLHTAEMAAPPAYVPEPVEAESAATVRSGLTNMHLGRALMSGIREARGLGRGGGKSFELAPLPAGVKIEKVYRFVFSFVPLFRITNLVVWYRIVEIGWDTFISRLKLGGVKSIRTEGLSGKSWKARWVRIFPFGFFPY